MLKLLKKLFAIEKKGDQDSVKRISNSINMQSSPEQEDYDDYERSFNQELLEKKLSLVENVLTQASIKTNEFNQLLDGLDLENPEDDSTQQAVKNIIEACDEISLNGLKILAGDEINIELHNKSLNVKLPGHAKSAFGLAENSFDFDSIKGKIQDLQDAIDSTQRELKQRKLELEVSSENIKSAGIRATWLEDDSA